MKKTLIAVIAILAIAAIALGGLYFKNNADKTAEIERLTADVGSRDEQITALTADITARDGQISELSADTEEKAGQIESLTADIAARDEQIATLTADITARDGQIAELSADTEVKAGQIESLTADVAARDEQITALTADLETKEQKIGTLMSERVEIDARNLYLEQENGKLQKKTEQQAGEIKALKTTVTELETKIAELERPATDAPEGREGAGAVVAPAGPTDDPAGELTVEQRLEAYIAAMQEPDPEPAPEPEADPATPNVLLDDAGGILTLPDGYDADGNMAYNADFDAVSVDTIPADGFTMKIILLIKDAFDNEMISTLAETLGIPEEDISAREVTEINGLTWIGYEYDYAGDHNVSLMTWNPDDPENTIHQIILMGVSQEEETFIVEHYSFASETEAE